MEVLHHYDDFHRPTSAREIVPYLMELARPASVVDIGCGLGQWLLTFQDHGVREILGLDGDHVPREKLFIAADNFQAFDLRRGRYADVGRKFDLAISLEVAEHIEPEFTDNFLDLLTSLSDVIAFSAAIPGQTGENHHNEQPPQYWAERFDRRGYVMLDAFRDKYWENENVNWWYRQNMYLVVRQELESRFGFPHARHMYIHPGLLDLYIKRSDRLDAILQGKIGVAESLRIAAGSLMAKFNK